MISFDTLKTFIGTYPSNRLKSCSADNQETIEDGSAHLVLA
jgi:hypothetical protein